MWCIFCWVKMHKRLCERGVLVYCEAPCGQLFLYLCSHIFRGSSCGRCGCISDSGRLLGSSVAFVKCMPYVLDVACRPTLLQKNSAHRSLHKLGFSYNKLNQIKRMLVLSVMYLYFASTNMPEISFALNNVGMHEP